MLPLPRPSFGKPSKVGIVPNDDHIGRVCSVASRRTRDEGCWPTGRRYEAAFIKVSEQPDRAGPPRHQARIEPMLGFKGFRTAAITITGIELLRRIHKGQFNLGRLASKIEVRPPSGMRWWQRNKAGSGALKSASCRPSGYLHQNRPAQLAVLGELDQPAAFQLQLCVLAGQVWHMVGEPSRPRELAQQR